MSRTPHPITKMDIAKMALKKMEEQGVVRVVDGVVFPVEKNQVNKKTGRIRTSKKTVILTGIWDARATATETLRLAAEAADAYMIDAKSAVCAWRDLSLPVDRFPDFCVEFSRWVLKYLETNEDPDASTKTYVTLTIGPLKEKEARS